MTKANAILEAGGVEGSAQTIVEAIGMVSGEDTAGMTIEQAIGVLPIGGGGAELKGLVYLSLSGSKFNSAPAWISTEEPTSDFPESGKTYWSGYLSTNGTTQITGGAWLAIPKSMTLTRFTVTDPDGIAEEITADGPVPLVWQVPDTYAGDSSKVYTLS